MDAVTPGAVVEINGKPRALFGWKESPRDPRDDAFTFKASKPVPIDEHFDPRIDMPAQLPRVEDQSVRGSCVGHGCSSAAEYLMKQGAFLEGKDPKTVPDLSRLFAYYGRVWYEGGRPDDDNGMFVRTGLKVLNKRGACREDLWPYDVNRYNVEPSAEAQADALKRTILSYHPIANLTDFMAALQEGTPVVGGFMVPASIGEAPTTHTGVVKMPDGRKALGGHCVVFIGFSQKKKWLIAQNSWGTGYGDKGYIMLPMAYWDDGLLTDCWAVKQARKVPA